MNSVTSVVKIFMSFHVQRIAVIGISGSGKTTFSKKLGDVTRLPVYHMDQLFWGENWASIPDEEWQLAEHKLIQKDRWIIEGYISDQSTGRLRHAEKIIYLDFAGIYCAVNAIKRWWFYKNSDRPDLPKGCRANFDLSFFWVIFRKKERRDIEKALQLSDLNHKLERLTHPKHLKKYLTEISECSKKF